MSEVKVEIKADSSALATGLAKAQKNIQNFGKDVTSNITDKLAGAFAGGAVLGGIGMLASGVMSAGKAILDFAGDLQDSADAMGIGTNALQGLNAAFAAGGSDSETTKKGIVTLTRSLQDIATEADGPARKALDALGISFEAIAGVSTDQALLLIADAMKGAADHGAALDAAITLIGKSAAKMAPALFGGAEAIQAIADAAPKIPPEDLKSMADAGDALDALILKSKVYGSAVLNSFSFTEAGMKKENDFWVDIGNDITNATDNALAYFGVIKKGPDLNRSADEFEAESLMTAEELANEKTVYRKVKKDPRIQANLEATAKIKEEEFKIEQEYNAKIDAESDKIASAEMSNAEQIEKQRRDQLDTEGQINALLEDRKNLQSEIASSSGMQRAQAQKDLIAVDKDLATAKDKAKKDMAAEGDEREKNNAADLKKKEDAAKKKKDLAEAGVEREAALAAQKKSGEEKRSSILDQMVDEEMKTPMQRANEERVQRERDRIERSLERRMKSSAINRPGGSKLMDKLSLELKNLDEKELPAEVKALTKKLDEVVNKINKG
jgi:hypothetical protein